MANRKEEDNTTIYLYAVMDDDSVWVLREVTLPTKYIESYRSTLVNSFLEATEESEWYTIDNDKNSTLNVKKIKFVFVSEYINPEEFVKENVL